MCFQGEDPVGTGSEPRHSLNPMLPVALASVHVPPADPRTGAICVAYAQQAKLALRSNG